MGRRSVFLAALVAAGLIATGGVPALAASPSPAATAPVTGSWGTAQAVPIAQGAAPFSAVQSVSCVPRGACYAVGINLTVSNPADLAFIETDGGGRWGKPAPIPGLEANLDDSAAPEAISCPAARDCVVVGEYGASTENGFILEEKAGKWLPPEPIPGLAALDTGAFPQVTDVTCAAPGYCTVTGQYAAGSPEDESTPTSTFVVDEANYQWGQAIEVPNLEALNGGGFAVPISLACPSKQSCTIEGLYVPAGPSPAARAAVRRALGAGGKPGLRDQAARAGLPAAAVGRTAGQPTAASLARRAAVAAVRGRPLDSADSPSALVFVDSEVAGNWQQASSPALPGVTATGLELPSSNVACSSAGNCLAAGVYAVSSSASSATGSYLLTQSGGAWSATENKPASAAAAITALACPAPGGCVAGGTSAKGVAMTLHQTAGVWSATTTLPGATALTFKGKKAQQSGIDLLDCPLAGNCTAGGTYLWNESSNNPGESPFVATEVNGRWSSASVPGGIVALNTGALAEFNDLSCASVATCAVVGSNLTSKGIGGFWLAEIPLRATAAAVSLAHSTITYGKEQSQKISVKVTASGAVPGGTLNVLSGTHLICAVPLKSGKGSCTLSAKRLARGTYHLYARYPGSFGFGISYSKTVTLKVAA